MIIIADSETQKKCLNFAKQLKRIQAMNSVGCKDIEIEAMTVWLRDISDNFSEMWRDAGFTSKPLIEEYRLLEKKFTVDCEAIWFGNTEEKVPNPIPIMAGSLAVSLVDAENRSLTEDVAAESFYHASNNLDLDLTSGNWIPWIKEEMSISKFFDAPIIYWHGQSISRLDIIEFACYGLGIVHTNAKKYDKKREVKRQILQGINDNPHIFMRNNILYLLLYISRSLSEADCTRKYLDRVCP